MQNHLLELASSELNSTFSDQARLTKKYLFVGNSHFEKEGKFQFGSSCEKKSFFWAVLEPKKKSWSIYNTLYQLIGYLYVNYCDPTP